MQFFCLLFYSFTPTYALGNGFAIDGNRVDGSRLLVVFLLTSVIARICPFV